jgi:putative membrane protein
MNRAALLALLSTLATAAVADQGNYHYGPHMWGGGGWMGWFVGPVMMIATIAIAVAVVVLVIRWLGGLGHGSMGSMHQTTPPAKPPLEILKERYARGEIDKEEYEERKRVLES